MSYVTTVIIVTDYQSQAFEEAITTPVNLRLYSEFADTFRELDMDKAGGTKGAGGHVYAAGLNYCDRELLFTWLSGLPWSSWGVVTVETEGEFAVLWRFGELIETPDPVVG